MCSSGSWRRRRSCSARRYSVADIALYAYTHVAPELGLDLGRFPAVTAWLRRVEEQPGYLNDLEQYPQHAGAGGASAHG